MISTPYGERVRETDAHPSLCSCLASPTDVAHWPNPSGGQRMWGAIYTVSLLGPEQGEVGHSQWTLNWAHGQWIDQCNQSSVIQGIVLEEASPDLCFEGWIGIFQGAPAKQKRLHKAFWMNTICMATCSLCSIAGLWNFRGRGWLAWTRCLETVSTLRHFIPLGPVYKATVPGCQVLPTGASIESTFSELGHHNYDCSGGGVIISRRPIPRALGRFR